MPVEMLEHYTIRCTSLERTRDFYRDVLGLVVGDRPKFPFKGYWLYLGDQPIIHMQNRGEGMGGRGDTYPAAAELTAAWEHAAYFELYDDALPTLEALRECGVKLGLLSNSSRDLDAFVVHHGLEVDAILTSGGHGKAKPHASIFRRMLQLLGTRPDETAMVGDAIEDDVRGAEAVGMRALLVDREGRFPDVAGRLDDLREVPAALGLVRGST